MRLRLLALLAFAFPSAQASAQAIDTAYSNGNPEWSPDGSKILFTTDRDGNSEVYVMNTDGSQPVNLTRHPGLDMHPNWSPDGSHILFDSDRSGDSEVYIMRADGSEVRRLTVSPGRDLVPRISPDGARIVFNSARDGNWEVYVMNTDGSDPVNITNHPDTDIVRSWSADGQIIQFDSDRDTEPGRARQAYSMYPDGSMLVRLTTSSFDDRFLRRGPPGTSLIAFTSTRGDGNTRGLYVMERDGSSVRLLFDGPGADTFPTWSPDGSRLAFRSDMSGSGDIYIMNADGTDLRRITDGSAGKPSR